MPKRTIKYQAWLLERLGDPIVAANYLKAVLLDSPELFPTALKKVAEAQGFPMAKIAETAGVERESVYRMLSETGNPTWVSLRGIVKALNLRFTIEKVAPDSSNSDNKNKKEIDGPLRTTAPAGFSGTARFLVNLPVPSGTRNEYANFLPPSAAPILSPQDASSLVGAEAPYGLALSAAATFTSASQKINPNAQ
jgi:probable addiction module antidote protein